MAAPRRAHDHCFGPETSFPTSTITAASPHCLVTLTVPEQGYPLPGRGGKDTHHNIYSHYLNLYSSQLVFKNVEAKKQPCGRSSSKL